MPRRVTFLTRPGCGLCADVLPKLNRFGRLLGIAVEVCDITEDRRLEDEYHLRIPVILGTDGSVMAEGPISNWEAFRVVLSSRR